MILETVGDLINHLEKLGRKRSLTVDVAGNTFPPEDDDFWPFDLDDDTSPIIIQTALWFGDTENA